MRAKQTNLKRNRFAGRRRRRAKKKEKKLKEENRPLRKFGSHHSSSSRQQGKQKERRRRAERREQFVLDFGPRPMSILAPWCNDCTIFALVGRCYQLCSFTSLTSTRVHTDTPTSTHTHTDRRWTEKAASQLAQELQQQPGKQVASPQRKRNGWDPGGLMPRVAVS